MSNCHTISTGINAKCDTSVGGVKKVLIANYVEDALTVTGDTVTAIDSSATWYEYTFRKGTANMTSTMNIDDANGVSYVSTDLVLTFGKMDAKKRTAINALTLAEVMVIVQDCNGIYHFLGKDEGVQATTAEGATGQARGDSNHYSCTLQDNSQEFPYIISNDLMKDITPVAEA